MRHRKKSEKFSRPRAQRKALIRSLLRSLVISYRIKTTAPKAKAIRRWMDKLITWAKRNDLHSRRLAYQVLGDHKLVKKLFMEIPEHFRKISGGYTRVINVGYRKGDGALTAIIELTQVRKEKKIRVKKGSKTAEKGEAKPAEAPAKKEKEKTNFVSGVRKIFKKEKGTL